MVLKVIKNLQFVFGFLVVCTLFHQELHTLALTDIDNHNISASTTLQLAHRLSELLHEIADEELGSDVINWSQDAPVAPDLLLEFVSNKLNDKLSAASHALHNIVIQSVPGNLDVPSFTHPCPYKHVHTPSHPTFTPLLNWTLDLNIKSSERVKDLIIKRHYYMSHKDYATDSECDTMAHTHLRYTYHRVVQPNPKLVIMIVDSNMSGKKLNHALNVVRETSRALHENDLFALMMTNSTSFVKFEDSCSKYGVTEVGNATETNKLLLGEYISSVESSHEVMTVDTIWTKVKQLLEQHSKPSAQLVVVLSEETEKWNGALKDDQLQANVIIENTGEITVVQSNNKSSLTACITPTDKPGKVATALLSLMPRNGVLGDIIIDTPVWEATEHDFVVPILLPLEHGVLGLDLYWTDLAEDIVYLQSAKDNRRVFVTDLSGKVIMHSSYPRPEMSTDKIKFTDVKNIENVNYTAHVRNLMLTREVGNETVYDNHYNKWMTYRWKRIQETLVVCVVSEMESQANSENKGDDNKRRDFLTHNIRDLLYHRLDVFPPRSLNLCQHFLQMVTLDRGAIYLSPSSFKSPFFYLQQMSQGGEDAVSYMRNYLAYLRSVANGLLSNPGLKEGVRRDAVAMQPLLQYFRRRHLSGAHTYHVVRRYSVAESGVVGVFPGGVMDARWAPGRADWYRRAATRPDVLCITPPRIDPAGAGLVLTLARKAHGLVIAMDITLGFFQALLEEAEPLCRAPNIRCFVMDSRGYLLAHPALNSDGPGPAEHRHVTHRESVVAIDMLSHQILVSKKSCLDIAGGTVQRYYVFNESLTEVLSNANSGDHCAQYYVTGVKGTDILVGVVRTACTAGAFCPCSVIDRLCLNCHRMERTECECPCECATTTRRGTCAAEVQPLPACDTPAEQLRRPPPPPIDLTPCPAPDCSGEERISCSARAGCSWCGEGADGRVLDVPYCGRASECWGGTVGAMTPYGGGGGAAPGGPPALGPVVACVACAALVVACAAWCVRGGVRPERSWGMPAPAPRSPRERLLAVEPAQPPPRAPSDLGYSTMSPPEDSVCTDPPPLSDDTRSDVSAPARARPSPLPRPVPRVAPPSDATVLPRVSPPLFLAPVTVHRQMDAC